ncbi:MAG TPA: Gfo/Idh/MocA family oxidoreductase [Candidatus Pelagibacter bacterium]|jgi:predicted dehydrogenase|nr:Gfo/Idh/MocA family oxidoreductase [Candidatus Pelagibacter bacterium]|tara:strand:+ start:2220 stop:3377 length:1158 start_codon:yes stop_codon:yes gene_type:complete
MNKVFKVGLIGCGHIAETYFRAQKYFNNIKIMKCADINNKSAEKCASIYGIKALSVNEILNDKEVEIILNLTIPKAHYEVAKKALLHNKHVYSEKPLAINFKDGKELLNIANKKKLYIGNAPDTFLGGGNQKSKELLEKNTIGKINLGNAIFAFPGVQSYHPNPESWFSKKEGGPVIDMGPYYLTALVNLLGPAKEVSGSIMRGVNYRTIGIGPKKGKKFKVECPTTYLSTVVFENDTVIRLTLSFDVIAHQRNHIELYGKKGSLIVPDPNMFGGSVYICKKLGDTWKELKTEKMSLGKINIRNKSLRANESSTNANYRGAGLSEMAYCIENRKKHRCSGELSLHVLDIIQSTMKASKTGKKQKIKTTCKIPKKFTEKEIRKLLN